MGLPTEVIAHAIRSTSGDPDESAELIAKYESQRDQVAARTRKIRSIRDRAEKEIQSLLQVEICPHEVRKPHGDPSGGSDTYDECLICGESIPERRVRFT